MNSVRLCQKKREIGRFHKNIPVGDVEKCFDFEEQFNMSHLEVLLERPYLIEVEKSYALRSFAQE